MYNFYIEVNHSSPAWQGEPIIDINALYRLIAAAFEHKLVAQRLADRTIVHPTLSIMLSDDDQIQHLNKLHRNKDKPTNVLSFPLFDGKEGLLGDVILSYTTIKHEALEQEKPFDHHVAHMLIHGTLHLLGFDHETAQEAEEMEKIEREVLTNLSIPDPYAYP